MPTRKPPADRTYAVPLSAEVRTTAYGDSTLYLSVGTACISIPLDAPDRTYPRAADADAEGVRVIAHNVKVLQDRYAPNPHPHPES